MFESDFGKFLYNLVEENQTTFFYTVSLKNIINELEELQVKIKNISI